MKSSVGSYERREKLKSCNMYPLLVTVPSPRKSRVVRDHRPSLSLTHNHVRHIENRKGKEVEMTTLGAVKSFRQ